MFCRVVKLKVHSRLHGSIVFIKTMGSLFLWIWSLKITRKSTLGEAKGSLQEPRSFDTRAVIKKYIGGGQRTFGWLKRLQVSTWSDFGSIWDPFWGSVGFFSILRQFWDKRCKNHRKIKKWCLQGAWRPTVAKKEDPRDQNHQKQISLGPCWGHFFVEKQQEKGGRKSH